MGKVRSKASGSNAKPQPASQLRLNLFGPGMTPLHRAGLGGLACTLRYIEKQYKAGALSDREVPGHWSDKKPPWHIDAHSITLDFSEPKRAEGYLKRLFKLAFGLKDGLIHLPGQYHLEPSQAVRAELQAGLLLTFLQHGRVRSLASESARIQHDPEGTGVATVSIEFKRCNGYKHQDGADGLTTKGVLTTKNIEVIGPLNPGAVVRHVAFTSDTRIEEPPERIIPLYFALVGCISMAVNRGVGVLLIPEVDDLLLFAKIRPFMTPTSVRECRIACASDAAMQAQVRLRSKSLLDAHDLPGLHAVTFMPTSWASQQKSRVLTTYVPPGDELRLSQFEVALAELPPKVVAWTVKRSVGRGKNRKVTEKTEWFWTDSVIRPLIADNLSAGKPWYSGFVRLMTATDSNGNPIRNKLAFERKGLHAMIEKIPWDSEAEAVVVRAVHEALRSRYRQIADENKESPVAMKNRWQGEYDRWRLAFAGAKTADQFRNALCDLFSRSRSNSVLREKWALILPLLNERQWQLARDLALLALPSYSGQKDTDPENAKDVG